MKGLLPAAIRVLRGAGRRWRDTVNGKLVLSQRYRLCDTFMQNRYVPYGLQDPAKRSSAPAPCPGCTQKTDVPHTTGTLPRPPDLCRRRLARRLFATYSAPSRARSTSALPGPSCLAASSPIPASQDRGLHIRGWRKMCIQSTESGPGAEAYRTNRKGGASPD